MSADIIQLQPALYYAKEFHADTAFGLFAASGTICGRIDFIGPFEGSYPLSVDEISALIVMLQNARSDVVDNSSPLSDPRLYSSKRTASDVLLELANATANPGDGKP